MECCDILAGFRNSTTSDNYIGRLGLSLFSKIGIDSFGMRIATLTPTRDRRVLLNFCHDQICGQSVEVHSKYFINFDSVNNKHDLTQRIRQGYELAKEGGLDWVVIFEDDDAYPTNYIERFTPHMDRYDFIGDPNSLYYNIHTRRYQVFNHPRRASLFTTAFRVSALDKFRWPPDDTVFLDIKLWNYAKNFKCKFIDSGAVGIKGHGIGKHGGKGHTMELKHADPTGDFLKSKVTPRHFEFYTKLSQAFFCVVMVVMLNISVL